MVFNTAWAEWRKWQKKQRKEREGRGKGRREEKGKCTYFKNLFHNYCQMISLMAIYYNFYLLYINSRDLGSAGSLTQSFGTFSASSDGSLWVITVWSSCTYVFRWISHSSDVQCRIFSLFSTGSLFGFTITYLFDFLISMHARFNFFHTDACKIDLRCPHTRFHPFIFSKDAVAVTCFLF